jgi:F-type H+-transporting ATPase subunit gamma
MEVGCWCVGEKVQAALAEEGSEAAFQYHAPAGLNSVNEMVSDITHNLENYKNQQGIDFFYLCHNVISGKTGYAPTFYAILPLNQAWVMSHKAPWPSRCLPILGLSGHEMFRHLFRQHVYICIYRALVQSLAGENSARFVAMQSAEKNITEIEEDLIKLHREKRQTDITNELLDIISGFEANKKG